jgi:hypothetical protein
VTNREIFEQAVVVVLDTLAPLFPERTTLGMDNLAPDLDDHGRQIYYDTIVYLFR